jgi:hypothetical protein
MPDGAYLNTISIWHRSRKLSTLPYLSLLVTLRSSYLPLPLHTLTFGAPVSASAKALAKWAIEGGDAS